jgi:hypothetical protein
MTGGQAMSKKSVRDFECPVVHEHVQISLKHVRSMGSNNEKSYFVQCDQLDCQYVTENKAPCPLDSSMFAKEITEHEEKERQRREEKS